MGAQPVGTQVQPSTATPKSFYQQQHQQQPNQQQQPQNNHSGSLHQQNS